MAKLLKKGQMKPGTIAEAGSMSRLNTGTWRTYCPVTDLEKCTHCMICWLLCPDSAVQVEDGKKVGTNMQHCKGCGICATECPVDAIEIKLESEMSDDEKKG